MHGDDVPPDLTNAARAARLSGVHPATVGRWVDRGHIRGWRRATGRIQVSLSEVRAFARGEPTQVKPPPRGLHKPAVTSAWAKAKLAEFGLKV